MSRARRPQVFRAPLEAALQVELHELDVFAVRLWISFGFIGIVASIVFSMTISATLGLACGAVVVPYLGWFALVDWRLRRGPVPSVLRRLTAFVEGTIPWAFFLALHLIQGAGYALASWVPPMIFSLVIFGLTLRLRFAEALAIGLIGAVAYIALYFTLVRSALPPELAGRIL